MPASLSDVSSPIRFIDLSSRLWLRPLEPVECALEQFHSTRGLTPMRGVHPANSTQWLITVPGIRSPLPVHHF